MAQREVWNEIVTSPVWPKTCKLSDVFSYTTGGVTGTRFNVTVVGAATTTWDVERLISVQSVQDTARTGPIDVLEVQPQEQPNFDITYGGVSTRVPFRYLMRNEDLVLVPEPSSAYMQVLFMPMLTALSGGAYDNPMNGLHMAHQFRDALTYRVCMLADSRHRSGDQSRWYTDYMNALNNGLEKLQNRGHSPGPPETEYEG